MASRPLDVSQSSTVGAGMNIAGVGVLTAGRRDEHRLLTAFAFTVLAAGSAFAVFGLPHVPLHPPIHYVGVMDPLCGMTRGVTALMRGDLATAMLFNPASPLVVLASAALTLRAAIGLAARRWLNVRWQPRAATWAVLLLALLALTVRQQLHAALLQ